jgi:hypothetical protein
MAYQNRRMSLEASSSGELSLVYGNSVKVARKGIIGSQCLLVEVIPDFGFDTVHRSKSSCFRKTSVSSWHFVAIVVSQLELGHPQTSSIIALYSDKSYLLRGERVTSMK